MRSEKKWSYVFYASLLLGSIISRWLINFSELINIIFVFLVICFYFLLLQANSTISVKKKFTFGVTVIFHSIFLSLIITSFLSNYYPFHLNEKNESLSFILGGSLSFWVLFFMLIPMFVSFSKLKTDVSQTDETIESEGTYFLKAFHLNERTTIKILYIIALLIVFILPSFPMSALISAEEKGLTLFLLSIILVPTFVFLFLKPIEVIVCSIKSATIPKKIGWMCIVSALLMIFCAYVF